ncbi:hypothetical protein SBA3_4410002 [Candidatus Sulfopaludibacter sp. SbA3]|nr:hypothetical protein SBA3_4410002 [Candidatus Sulfopaludibacter sp. SbA3]
MDYQSLLATARAPELWTLHTSTGKPLLRSWNAEGWYVVLKGSRLLTFTSGNRTSPPERITTIFREIEKLPLFETDLSTARDVCLGYCYDPLGELGHSAPADRAKLLRSQ